MKGNQKVIDSLQELLCHELSAIDQYFMHSRIYADLGLTKLEARIAHESEEEKEHAQALIDRMLFLEGKPDLSSRKPLKIGGTVPAMLKNDLDYEYLVAQLLRDTIALCEKEEDFQTRQVLIKLLADTEQDHMYWLERQIGLIDKLGIQNYLQSQL